ncbi:MAG TPA: tRNA (adenosine(37)-N6)-threonylcarbamoyltransferase complex dimerization subunit type 1 TsaB [Thermodesulfobacteriota bacterium]|nr:tRNA (adenosine(37)-N6)-threonylcarbamoyltransferase complex dimerization subunit type 1 TsaB [Thermodesulfobacteriota bacterium]
MKILAIDTSTPSGSIALLEDDQLIAELTTCIQKTHAERLLPSIKTLLDNIGTKLEHIDGFALAIGPGSFTGLRIGLSTIKGLAWSLNKKVAGISTLEALAMNLPYSDKPVCPMLDARKKEVYAAVYKCNNNLPECIMPDTALSPDNLINKIKEPTIFLGDGIKVYGSLIKDMLKDTAVIAPVHLWQIKASSVGLLAWKKFKSGNIESPESIRLNYLRPSEAEIKVRLKADG